MENINGYTRSMHVDKCRYEFRNKKKYRYGTPVYSYPFRALDR
jgi:hypothetical protein